MLYANIAKGKYFDRMRPKLDVWLGKLLGI